MTHDERLSRFGRATLQILEADQSWSSDTAAEIARLAAALDLAEPAELGFFKSKEVP